MKAAQITSLRTAPTRAPRGLTLLELMAALAVVTVLAALALPSMGAVVQRHRLAAAAQALAGDLAQARFEAARLGQTLHLQAHTGPAWCWSVATASACDCQPAHQQAQARCLLKAVRADDHAGVRLLEPLQVQFDPNGAGVAAGATFESPRGQRLRVELGPMGRPRVCVPAGADGHQASAYPKC